MLLFPLNFALQWHITQRCNWRCSHCYQNNKSSPELPFQDLLKIFGQYLRLIRRLGTAGKRLSRLSLSGGEPLVRQDFFLLLEKLHKYNKFFYLTVLTNGSLIDRSAAVKLKALGVDSVQVSLEGLESGNDRVRGKGAFAGTLRAVEILNAAKVKVAVSFTLDKRNHADVLPLARLCRKLGVARLGVRRMVPVGGAAKIGLLSPQCLKKVYLDIERYNRSSRPADFITRGCEEGIFYQELHEPVNSCAVVDGRSMVVLPQGDVLACRRLPVILGNALKKDLLSIYSDSRKLKELRNLNNAHVLCRQCPDFTGCLAGAKCVSYAYFKRPGLPDPQCWKIFPRLPAASFFKGYKSRPGLGYRVHSDLVRRNFEEN